MKVAALVLQALIRSYQLLVSPFFPPCCRYFPSCSEYARQAVLLHGPAKGGWLALTRILRCHPWGGLGYDPVPETLSADHTKSGIGLNRACRHLNHHAGL